MKKECGDTGVSFLPDRAFRVSASINRSFPKKERQERDREGGGGGSTPLMARHPRSRHRGFKMEAGISRA